MRVRNSDLLTEGQWYLTATRRHKNQNSIPLLVLVLSYSIVEGGYNIFDKREVLSYFVPDLNTQPIVIITAMNLVL